MIAHLSGTLLAKHATSVIVDVGGVGRKTAERLVIELRDKMAALSSPALDEEIAAGASAGALVSEDALREDTLAALLQLGFPRPTAEKAVAHALSEGGELSVETLL